MSMKVSFMMMPYKVLILTKIKELENTFFLMEELMMGNGMPIKCTDMAYLSGQMEDNMMVLLIIFTSQFYRKLL